MLMFASVATATQDLAVMSATALTLGSCVAAYKHAINGYVRGGFLDCTPSTDLDVMDSLTVDRIV
jgi:hypothetical protein